MRRRKEAAAAVATCAIAVTAGLLVGGSHSNGSPAPSPTSDIIACKMVESFKSDDCDLARSVEENRRQCALPIGRRTGPWFCSDTIARTRHP